MSHAGQYLPGNSLLHRLDARGKFFGFLILIIATVLTDSPLGYLLLFAAAGGIVALSGLPVRVVLGTVMRMGRFFVLIFVLNTLFFSSETPIVHWWIITISREGMVQGANVVLRIIVILILSNAFTLTTPPMAIMGGIEDLLAPLGYLGLPVEQAAMILSVAVQFIPTLLEETDTIKKAQIARGARFESKKLWERGMALLPLIVPVFLSAFKRADELSMAMEVRGYRDAKHRTKKERKPISAGGWLTILVSGLICVAELLL